MSEHHVTELERQLQETADNELTALRAENTALRMALVKAEAASAQAQSELTLVQAGIDIDKANRLATDIVARTYRIHFNDLDATASVVSE